MTRRAVVTPTLKEFPFISYCRDVTFSLHLFQTMLKVQITFWRGDTHTTVGYVLMDFDAASVMSSCMIHEVACLNTSDHLPLSVTVNIPTDSIELGDDLLTQID